MFSSLMISNVQQFNKKPADQESDAAPTVLGFCLTDLISGLTPCKAGPVAPKSEILGTVVIVFLHVGFLLVTQPTELKY